MKKIGALLCGVPFSKDSLEREALDINDVKINFYDSNEEFDPDSIEIIIGYKIDNSLMDQLPNLKLVHVPFAGVDILDLSIFRGREHIYLSNSHVNSHAVSEYAVTLLFALVKRIPEFDRYMRKKIWKGRWMGDVLDGLRGKTLTILGFGAIGKEIAKRIKPFGINIKGIKREIKEEDKKYLSIVDELGKSEDLKRFLTISDYLIVSVPLTKQTIGIVGEEELDALGRGYIVNISRGKVVDETALFSHLSDGRLMGAALDVWWIYPKGDMRDIYPAHLPFWDLDNVIMSPHTAGFTEDFIRESRKESISNVVKIAKGELPINLVNIGFEY